MEKSKAGNELLGGNKEKFIETPSLRIAGHLLQWKDVSIQISNVSMVSTANIQIPAFPIWAVCMGVIGLILIRWMVLVTLVLVGLAAFVIYVWYAEKEKKKKLKALTISLNSGETFSILFNNVDFLNQVLSVFTNIFEAGGEAVQTTYQIDIENCKIDNQSSLITSGKV